MKQLYFLFIFLFFNICLSTTAENVVTIPEIKWEEDNERTTTTAPRLSIDDSFLYIYSEKQLENVTISIQNADGNIIYSIVTTIPACQTYLIPIASLSNGEYTLYLHNSNKYILADISIDN